MAHTLTLDQRPIYKVSMGRFNNTVLGRRLLAEFRQRGWLVVNKYCPDGQGKLFTEGIRNGDYAYACAGSVQL